MVSFETYMWHSTVSALSRKQVILYWGKEARGTEWPAWGTRHSPRSVMYRYQHSPRGFVLQYEMNSWIIVTHTALILLPWQGGYIFIYLYIDIFRIVRNTETGRLARQRWVILCMIPRVTLYNYKGTDRYSYQYTTPILPTIRSEASGSSIRAVW